MIKASFCISYFFICLITRSLVVTSRLAPSTTLLVLNTGVFALPPSTAKIPLNPGIKLINLTSTMNFPRRSTANYSKFEASPPLLARRGRGRFRAKPQLIPTSSVAPEEDSIHPYPPRRQNGRPKRPILVMSASFNRPESPRLPRARATAPFAHPVPSREAELSALLRIT